MAARGKTVQIRQFIFDNLKSHPSDIAAVVSKHFMISRQAVHSHLRELEQVGAIESSGRTKNKTRRLKALAQFSDMKQMAGLEEHVPWQNEIMPLLNGVQENVMDICSYGFTEILNNAIDHSGSQSVLIRLLRTPDTIDLQINDFGIGIFRKIKDAFSLPDELEAIKQLVKGKLTTDPSRHSGEGIFFTSRLFDCFSILSGELYYSHVRQDNDWLVENRQSPINGTHVRMTIAASSPLKIKDVFDSFASEGDDYSFSKTNVPVSLLQYGNDNLVSRSQAKRLLGRVELFREVYLDFTGVKSIGQAFADEVFRVFANEHPDVRLTPVFANENVMKMISRAKGHRPAENQRTLF